MGSKQTLFALVAAASTIAGAASVLGHGDATGVVAERMNGMMDMARSVKDLAAYLEGDVVEADAFDDAISTIERHAGETMLSLFPHGSVASPSEAKTEIWDDWDEFERLAKRLEVLAGDLRDAPTEIAPPPAQPSPTVSQAGNDIWAVLDEYELMGLAPRRSPVTTVSSGAPQKPSATRLQVFTELTATCASCHQKFRRAQ